MRGVFGSRVGPLRADHGGRRSGIAANEDLGRRDEGRAGDRLAPSPPPHPPIVSPASFPAPPSEKPSPAADTRLAADQCGVPRPLRPQAGRPERVPAGELLLAVDVPAREAQLREVPVQGVRAPRTACASLRETHRLWPSPRYILRCKAMVEQQQAAAAAAAAAAES